jgi:hypothetical protein
MHDCVATAPHGSCIRAFVAVSAGAPPCGPPWRQQQLLHLSLLALLLPRRSNLLLLLLLLLLPINFHSRSS